MARRVIDGNDYMTRGTAVETLSPCSERFITDLDCSVGYELLH